MRHRVTAFALVIFAAVGLSLGANASSPTLAAWSDRSYVSAVTTSGSWSAGGTCIAYNDGGNVRPGCQVTGIRYESWGTVGDRTRNYYVTFSAPSSTVHVTFDIDLRTATGNDATAMTWQSAAVGAGPQFTGTNGWSCAQLPRIQGRSTMWITETVYFQVFENKTAKSTYCG